MLRIFDPEYMQRVIHTMHQITEQQPDDPAVLEEHSRLMAPISAAMSLVVLAVVAVILAPHAHWSAWPVGVAIGSVLFLLYRAELRSGHRTTRRLRKGPMWLRAIVSAMMILAFLCLPAGAVALWLLGPVPWLAGIGIVGVTALSLWALLSWWWLQRTPVIYPVTGDQAADV